MLGVPTDLAGIAAGQGDLGEFPAVEVEAEEVLLVAHGDEQRRGGGAAQIHHAGVRAPVGDAALGAAEDAPEFSVGAVMEDVIFAVAIEDVELAVGQVQRPGRTIFLFLPVFSGGLRPTPLVERRAVERGFDDTMGREVGDEEDLAGAFSDEREAVGAGKLGAPFVHEPAPAVVDDHVIGRVIREQNDVAGAVAGEAMAVFDGRRGVEHAPAGDDAVTEIALAEQRRGRLGARGGADEGTRDGGRGGRAEKVATSGAGHGSGEKRAGRRPRPTRGPRPSARRGRSS